MRISNLVFLGVSAAVFVGSGCGDDSSGGPGPQCGNDVVEQGEECDGNNLAGEDCASLGLSGGQLACASDCWFDVSNCTSQASCGNDTREYPEACDGTDLLGLTCQMLGFASGTLACQSDCSAFDTSGCVAGVCGDGNVDYGMGEECDDGNTNDGDGCSSQCLIEPPATCGDGNLDIDQGEQCDDGNTSAGDGCSPACQYEPVGADCGNSNMDNLEVCDDGNLANGDNCNPTCNLTNTTEAFVGSQGNQGLQDGQGTGALIGGFGVLTADANYLYYADGPNNVIRQIDIATRDVVTIAGDAVGGTSGYVDDPVGTNARFPWVETLATDGYTLWVGSGHRIRAVDLTSPFAVTTVAGNGNQGHVDGIGTAAELDDHRGFQFYNGYVYMLDGTAATLRRFDPATTEVVTLAGVAYQTGHVDAMGTNARFISPRYMASDNSGMLYIADTNGNAIRAYNTVTTRVTTFAGDGTAGYVDDIGQLARIHRPRGMCSDGTSIYWSEFNQHTIRQGVLATQSVTTAVGTHCSGGPNCTGGYNEGVGINALFDSPVGIVFHFPTNSLFVVDGGNFVIRRIY